MQRSNPYSFQTPIFQNQSLEDSLTSLYTPPYQGKRPQFDAPVEHEPFPTALIMDHPESTSQSSLDQLIAATNSQQRPQKGSFIPTVLLLGGAHFAVIGLMQLFFSTNGILRLEWNANYWFFYFLMSAPLLYFGTKKVKQLDH